MKSWEYPSFIPGFRFLGITGGGDASYQTDATIEEGLLGRLLTELPEDCQICYVDPDAEFPEGSHELVYLWIRRDNEVFFVQKGSHGCFGTWTEEPLGMVLKNFGGSRLVRNPVAEMESFRVGLIPEHQRNDHRKKDKRASRVVLPTPWSLQLRYAMDGHSIEYRNVMELCQGGPEVGNLFVDGKPVSPEARFGGPLLVDDLKVYLPVFDKSFFYSGFRLAQVDLLSGSVDRLGKRKKLIFLDRITDGVIYYFTDMEKVSLEAYSLKTGELISPNS